MPYKSEKQRKFMYSQHPEIAKRFEKEGKNYINKQHKALKNKIKKDAKH